MPEQKDIQKTGDGHSEHVHGRVSRVEAALEGQREAIQSLKRDNERLEQTFDQQMSMLNRKMDQIVSGLSASGRTNWSTLIALGGLLVVIVGGIGVSYVRPLEVKDQQHEASITRTAEVARAAEINAAVLEERVEWVIRMTTPLSDGKAVRP